MGVVPDFGDFVGGRGPAFVRLAFALTGDRHLAEDLVQEALARAHLRWNRIDDHDAYVHRTVLNAFLSWRRRRSSGELPADDAVLDRMAPADMAASATDRVALTAALLSLPPRQRAVVVLRYLEDRSDHDIARLLGCTESTVRTQAQRALSALRSAHAALYVEEVSP